VTRANLLWEAELKAGLLSLSISLLLANEKSTGKACHVALQALVHMEHNKVLLSVTDFDTSCQAF